MAGKLFDEHAAIIAAADDFIRAVERRPRIRLDELSRMRMRISHLIKLHRQAEEEEIVSPYRMSDGIALMPQVKTAMDEIRIGWLAYSEHVRIWTPKAVEADWDGYVAALHVGRDALRKMMAHEEDEVYHPVLDHVASQNAVARTRTYSIGSLGITGR